MLLTAAGACVAQPEFGGPLTTRNQHPAQLLVMHMPPAASTIPAAGRVEVRANAAYSSLFLLGQQDQTIWEMDGEYLRSALDLRVGLGDDLQLGVELAAAYTDGGFLDALLIDYHDAFGLPDQGRDTYTQDAYRIEASRGGQTLWSVDRSDGAWLDLPITLTWRLCDGGPRQLGLAVRGGIELPTGDQNRGFGSGTVEASIGALADYQLGGVLWSGHLQHTFAGTPDGARNQGLRFADVTSGGLAAELPLSEGLHALVQVEWETSTLRRLGVAEASGSQLLLWLGGRLVLNPACSIDLAVGEDLRGYLSPDVTMWLGVCWRL